MSVSVDENLREAERQNWGANRSGVIDDTIPLYNNGPYVGGTDKSYWEEMPIDNEIVKSHNEWVANRRKMAGVSRYKPESIEPTTNWVGLKPGGICMPEPVPQRSNRAELTEYGPADFQQNITSQRLRCGKPVTRPSEMANSHALPFNFYGF